MLENAASKDPFFHTCLSKIRGNIQQFFCFLHIILCHIVRMSCLLGPFFIASLPVTFFPETDPKLTILFGCISLLIGNQILTFLFFPEQQSCDPAYHIIDSLAACAEAFPENIIHRIIEGLQRLF